MIYVALKPWALLHGNDAKMPRPKPQPRREVAIIAVAKSIRYITFNATPDAANDIAAFGDILALENNVYRLLVDARYDWQEVLEHIERYGQESTNA